MTHTSAFQWAVILFWFVGAVLWFFSAAVPALAFDTIASGAYQGDGVPLNVWAKKAATRNKWAAAVRGWRL
jgi:hypothetical protein